MCILFIHINNDASQGPYSLVIASNRDEKLSRPSKPAVFWPESEDCIGGQDLEPGREGGTWMAMSKGGKLGFLLNRAEGYQPDRKNRGFLVRDFLSNREDAASYIADLAPTAQDYNKFNLVLLERTHVKWALHCYSNSDDLSPIVAESGIIGVSNSALRDPFRKVEVGKERFQEVLRQFQDSPKDILKDRLFDFLCDKTSCLPDPMFASRPLPEGAKEQLSRIHVDLYAADYGTRTSTIVLVDHHGNVDYVERDLDTSSLGQGQEPVWNTVTHCFTLHPNPASAKV